MAWVEVVKTNLDVSGTTPLAITNSPASAQNDLLYAFVTVDTGAVVTGPSGWTKLATADSGAGDQMVQLWRKVAGAGEGTSYSWSTPGGSLTCITFIQLTGGDTTTPEDVTSSTNTQLATGAPSATSITTVTDGCRLLACWNESNAANSITADASMTSVSNLLATGHPDAHAVATATQATHGATGNKIGSWTGTPDAASILVAARPTGGVAGNPNSYVVGGS